MNRITYKRLICVAIFSGQFCRPAQTVPITWASIRIEQYVHVRAFQSVCWASGPRRHYTRYANLVLARIWTSNSELADDEWPGNRSRLCDINRNICLSEFWDARRFGLFARKNGFKHYPTPMTSRFSSSNVGLLASIIIEKNWNEIKPHASLEMLALPTKAVSSRKPFPTIPIRL